MSVLFRVELFENVNYNIFVDFLGPVFSTYCILFIVDYATGYTMLIPTYGQDAVTVANAILDKWIFHHRKNFLSIISIFQNFDGITGRNLHFVINV